MTVSQDDFEPVRQGEHFQIIDTPEAEVEAEAEVEVGVRCVV
jgi:hypothetical protein